MAIYMISLFAITDTAFSQYTDRFDGTTSGNWQRESLLDIGTANWAITNGAISFITPGTASESQVFVKNQQFTLSNSQDWSLMFGMANQTKAQLQVYVANNDFSDYFGVTLGGYFGALNQKWGAEFPGQSWWTSTGIRSSAPQTGSIKIAYDSQGRTYSLLYSNAGYDPISNNYSWSLLAANSATATDSLHLYIGINAGTLGNDGLLGIQPTSYGQMSVDNLKVVPEPSVSMLILAGIVCLFLFKCDRKKKIIQGTVLFICLANISSFATSLNEGLLAYYKFDGNSMDSSGNGRDLSFRLPISYGQGRNNGQAVLLNGRGNRADYLTTSTATTSEYSVSLWIKPFSISYNFPEWTYLVDNVYGTKLSLRYGNNTQQDTSFYNYKQFSYGAWGPDTITVNPFIENDWQNITVTQDSQNWCIYYNGDFVSSRPLNNRLFSKDNYFLFNSEWFNYEFNGLAQDVYIYERALSPTEVTQLVPEPSALSLLAVGLGGLALVRRRRS